MFELIFFGLRQRGTCSQNTTYSHPFSILRDSTCKVHVVLEQHSHVWHCVMYISVHIDVVDTTTATCMQVGNIPVDDGVVVELAMNMSS